jgi:hypothetical protein
MLQTDKVESCLYYKDAKKIELLGKEDLDNVQLWHVKVQDVYEQEQHFWIEPTTFNVWKQEYYYKNLFRETKALYSTKNKDKMSKIFPDIVEIKLSRNGEVYQEIKYVLKAFASDVPIPENRWLLEGMKLPIGVPVSDIMIHERLGYWDGKKLSQLPAGRITSDIKPSSFNFFRILLIVSGLVLIIIGVSMQIFRRKK